MFSRLWSESFWLPSNTTWADVTNGPDKTVVYADIKDYWVQIPLVILILTLRFLCERYLFAPLGGYLKINGVKVKKATPNARLEAEYRKSSKCKNATSLAKQLDLTEREIERWWRLRRSQDKPTTLAKFCESMWRGCCFLFYLSIGVYAVWGQEWLWNVEKAMEGYPHQGITPEIWWSYMLASAFYISLIITQFRDVRRKDFWQILVHHYSTVALLFLSWISQCFRIGCLVMILDITDIVLEFSKASKYAKYNKVVSCTFTVFVSVWVVSRLMAFPFLIMPIAYRYRSISSITYLMFLLLSFVLVLSCYWSWIIFLVVKRTFSNGGFTTDVRSSESEDSDVTDSQISKEDARSDSLVKSF